MPVLNPDHLLEQAARLSAPLGGGSPRQADLRRAISSIYYAVFHAVLSEAADDFVGKTHRASPRYALVYRSVDHRSLRALCDDVRKDALPARYARYVPVGGFGSELRQFSVAFVALYEKRQLADYDPHFRATRSDVLADLANGHAALTLFRRAGRSSRKAFLTLVVVSPRS